MTTRTTWNYNEAAMTGGWKEQRMIEAPMMTSRTGNGGNGGATMTATKSPTATRSNHGEILLKLENVAKVFYTDEVETHALSEVHLEIRKGEYV